MVFATSQRVCNRWVSSSHRAGMLLLRVEVVCGTQHMPNTCRGEFRRPSVTSSCFKNGRNQAVCIPREFELPGDEAIMRKEGKRLVIEPAPRRSLLAVWRGWKRFPRTSPQSLTCHLIRLISNTLPARHQRGFRPRPQPARPHSAAHSPDWRVSHLHQHHGRCGVALWPAKKRSPRLTAQRQAVLGALEVLLF